MLRRSLIRRHPLLAGIALLLLVGSFSMALYLVSYSDPTVTREIGVVVPKPVPLDLPFLRIAICRAKSVFCS
jgi:hypothetical protein